MNGIITSEWAKLRRRGMLAALLATITVAALVAVVGVATAGEDTGGRREDGRRSVAELIGPYGLGRLLADAGGVLGVIALGVVAASVAGEYSTGALRNLLVREPRRVRLMVGKLVGLALAISLAVLIAAAVAVLVAALTARAQGHPVGEWTGSTGRDYLLSVTARLIVTTVGWGLLGALLGVLFRAPAAAIGAGLAYALPLEAILTAVDDGVARWLPGRLLSGLVAGDTATASMTDASLTLLLYGTLATAGLLAVFARRDVAG